MLITICLVKIYHISTKTRFIMSSSLGYELNRYFGMIIQPLTNHDFDELVIVRQLVKIELLKMVWLSF